MKRNFYITKLSYGYVTVDVPENTPTTTIESIVDTAVNEGNVIWHDSEITDITEDDNSYKFDYQLLDRHKQDCEFFLGHGNRQEKYLWGKTVDEHITNMRELYAKLPQKPEWLTEEQIDDYEKCMKEGA